MAEQTAPPTSDLPSGGQVFARYGPGFAALVGLVSLAILVQAVLAGIFIQPGAHKGALNAHDVNADVTIGLSLIAMIYALVLLRRPGRSLAIGSVVLFVLLVIQDSLGHTRSPARATTASPRFTCRSRSVAFGQWTICQLSLHARALAVMASG